MSNVFLSSTQPGRIDEHEWSAELDCYPVFDAAFTIWKYVRNYDPTQEAE